MVFYQQFKVVQAYEIFITVQRLIPGHEFKIRRNLRGDSSFNLNLKILLVLIFKNKKFSWYYPTLLWPKIIMEGKISPQKSLPKVSFGKDSQVSLKALSTTRLLLTQTKLKTPKIFLSFFSKVNIPQTSKTNVHH